MKVSLKSAMLENSKTICLNLPEEEAILKKHMIELGLPLISTNENCVVVKSDYLENLTNNKVNIDELQYLAKRMECLDNLETFYAAAKAEKYTNVRDLINLTWDIESGNYYLVTDFQDKLKLSQNYCMTKEILMSTEEFDSITEKEIHVLFNTEIPVGVSEFGVLYKIKDEKAFEYDGYLFPQYFYDLPVLDIEIVGTRDNGELAEEYLYFPCDDISIDKAVNRLVNVGVSSIFISEFKGNIFSKILDSIGNEANIEKLYELNKICEALQNAGVIYLYDERFQEICKFCNPRTIKELYLMIGQIGNFDYIPNIKNPEDYGSHILFSGNELKKIEDLIGFVKLDEFGESQLKNVPHIFTDKGIVIYRGRDVDLITELLYKQDISCSSMQL